MQHFPYKHLCLNDHLIFSFMKKNLTHNQRGFTLVEMLVAVLIFSLSLTALMTVSAKGLRASREAQSQVEADYLALEALEGVRNIRDSAFIAGYDQNNWTGVFNGVDIFGGSGCYSDNGNCNIYFSGDRILLQTCSGGCPVYYNDVSNAYFQPEEGETPDGSQTKYFRTISFDTPGGNDSEVFVTVTVSWDGGEVVYTEGLHLWI